MVSRIEAYNQDNNEWMQAGDLPPGQKGSISQNLPDGGRELYVFECSPDDSHTTIYKAPFGIDMEIGQYRILSNTAEMAVVHELKKGDEPYLLSIKTDRSNERRMIRFSHI